VRLPSLISCFDRNTQSRDPSVSQKAESLGAIGSWRLGAAQFAAVDRMQPFLSGEKSLNRKPRRIAAVDRHPLIPAS